MMGMGRVNDIVHGIWLTPGLGIDVEDRYPGWAPEERRL